jgi:hypothetical protein
MHVRGTNGDAIELTATTEYADVNVVVRVQCRGFSGATDAFVAERAWDAFLEEVAALERTRQGAATLVSMSPDELSLTIR